MKKVLFLVLHLVSVLTFAQRTELFVSQADELFAAAQYVKAIPYYDAALEKNPNYVKAKYQLGECYRFTFDYESAQFYYGDIAKNNDPRYPLAGFYYGQMQKLRGQYSNALTTFKIFQRLIKDQELTEDDKFRPFYQQAKVEIDGCQLAINQVAMEHPDHSLAPVLGELNSPFNDFAAFSLGTDDLLCITSARKAGKGALQNNTFGQSFTDLYRFQRDAGGTWTEYSPKDRFESTLNSKWGEGSGSFNRERSKFYYTNCNEDLGDFCHIFVSYLQGGRWSEPIALNANINLSGYTSKHPSLTPGGDTLFFASNRVGTLGGDDIWMSVNAGGDNWSPPVNLGDQINTRFREVSPFYSPSEKVLFFASDGHRGFGGLDIYIAKGKSFKQAEIHNAGMPFNSSRDDVFFFLGNKKGYLSSNREGGVGKLDIFEFDIESKARIVSEVSSAETIAGRNSLFTDDYNFDSQETDVINQIISRRLSSSFSQVAVYLTTEQLNVYNSLGRDDKERIDRIVNGRIRKMTSSSLRSIRSEDEYYYQQLDADKRKKVDRVVSTYLEGQGLGLSIALSDESNQFYNEENPNDREKLDILISERLKTSADYRPRSINYEKLTDQDKKSVDGIVLKYLDQKRSIDGIRLSVAERVFMRDMVDEKSVTVNSAIKEKLLDLSREEKYKLLLEDNEFYEDLTSSQKESLKGIASAFLVADLNSFDQKVDQTDLSTFTRMGTAANQRVNKLILKMISNLASADAYQAETLFQTGELLAANSGTADETLQKLFSLDRGMTETDKESIERFVRSTYKAYLEVAPVFIKPASDTGGFAIEERVPFYSSTAATKALAEPLEDDRPFVLSQETLDQYAALSPEKRGIIDRLIGLDYVRKAYEGTNLETEDPKEYRNLAEREKVFVEVLSRNFRGEPTKENEKLRVNEAFAYYNNLAKSRKEVINRMVLSRTFLKRNDRYSLDFEDVGKSRNLSAEERNIREQIQRFRFQNARVITQNQEVEALDHPDPEVETISLARPAEVEAAPVSNNGLFLIPIEIPKYAYQGYQRMTMKGKLMNRLGRIAPGKAVTLLKQDNTETSITGYTDNDGVFEFKIPASEYKMITEARAETAQFSVTEFTVVGVDAAKTFEESSVAYFDTNSEQLRPEAKKLLDEVVTEYRRSPVRIEVESHTDDVGNAEYNRQLSRRRGNSAFEYLVSKGVKKSEISVVWHGFEKPIASNDNPYGRQLNRRMDIRMLGTSKINFTAGQYFLVRPSASLTAIATNLGVSVNEIMATNGLTSSSVREYQPLRIKSSKTQSVDSNLLVPSNSSIASNTIYVVKRGETIADISKRFNMPEELIMEINELTSPTLKEGMELQISTGKQ
ncbi:MAG: OmpA family protein [Cyclobacteriaceae bacterium]